MVLCLGYYSKFLFSKGSYTSRTDNQVETQLCIKTTEIDNNVEEAQQQCSKIVIGGGYYFSEDIIISILLKLPAQSVVRFMSVCKDWRNLISKLDPSFIQQLMAKVFFIYPTEGTRNNLVFKLKNNGIESYFCFERKDIRVERACKNFVLFRSETEDYGNRLFVFDAINLRYRQLPIFSKLEFRPNPKDIYSLVYDASAKTCKVIAFNKRRFSIFRLNPGRERWRNLRFPSSQKIVMSSSTTDLNGVFYWVAKRYGNYDNGAFIQPMNIASEKLMSIIKVPGKFRKINCHLLKIKGSLCFMNAASDNELDIWVLKDSINSLWILQRKICFQSMVDRPNCLTSFWCVSVEPWLVVETIDTTYILITIEDKSKPYLYNLETEVLSQIAVDYNNLKVCQNLHAVSFTDFDLAPNLEDLGPKLLDLMLE